MPQEILGRDREVAALDAFLKQIERGPAGLSIEGEPGIGKTTLWLEGCTRAAGRTYRVLASRPAQPDGTLAFAGLADLLAEIDPGLIERLPPPQRRALDAALLRVDRKPGTRSEPRAVFTAALAVLTSMAAEGPVVMAVDDVQWLDASTRRALEFAARRLGKHPIGLLVSSRHSDGSRLGDLLGALGDRWNRIHLDPLTLAATHLLLKQRFDAFPRPTLLRIHAASGGNPLFALEIATALGGAELRPDEGLPVPEDVRSLIRHRIRQLPKATRSALIRAAAASHPTTTLVAGSVEPAQEAGLVDVFPDGRIAFSHPLYRNAVYESGSPHEVARAHLELAERVSDLEERARHLALATSAPEEHVASELDRAAYRARSRGAPDAAAELMELAIARTPSSEPAALRSRKLAAADYHISSGGLGHGRTLLLALLGEAPPPGERIEVLLRLAAITEDSDTSLGFCDLALMEAGDDHRRLSQIHTMIGRAAQARGDIRQALGAARTALAHAEEAGVSGLTGHALGYLVRWEIWTAQLTPGLLERALALEERGDHLRVWESPRVALARLRIYQGRLDEAGTLVQALLAEAAARGDEWSSTFLEALAADIACRRGDWHWAAKRADSACILAEQVLGSPDGWTLYLRALVDAHLGRVESARASAEAGMAASEGVGFYQGSALNASVLAFLDLSVSDAAAAARRLGPVLRDLRDGGWALAPHPAAPIGIEALIAVGEVELARELLAQFEREALALESSWLLAVADRCRGLLAATRHDHDAAVAAFERAVAAQDRLPSPFERARTLLALGALQRRLKQKRRARESLSQAVAVFDELGAPLWAEKARAALARTGERRPASHELTETERQVAGLVASGMTNREVAARLFMSPKTVEANLARVYRKLAIHSRAELGVRLAHAAPHRGQT
jgi:DNA-binding CsgD family transcriptional regulator